MDWLGSMLGNWGCIPVTDTMLDQSSNTGRKLTVGDNPEPGDTLLEPKLGLVGL